MRRLPIVSAASPASTPVRGDNEAFETWQNGMEMGLVEGVLADIPLGKIDSLLHKRVL